MNRTSVLAALKRGDTVCHNSNRWHVGARILRDGAVCTDDIYRFDVFTGVKHSIKDFTQCFIHKESGHA